MWNAIPMTQVVERSTLDAERKTQDAGCEMQRAEYGTQDVACGTQVVERSTLDTERKTRDAGCEMQNAEYGTQVVERGTQHSVSEERQRPLRKR